MIDIIYHIDYHIYLEMNYTSTLKDTMNKKIIQPIIFFLYDIREG
jgi:hypothetical protein